MSNATIYDVAKAASVSIATVSRVLNTPQQVNAITRQRVLAVIDELHFVPKADATARARKSTGRIGVLAPFFTYPSFMQRLRGVASVLNGSQHELVVYSVDSAAHYHSQLETLPLVRRIDGLIIMSLLIDEGGAKRLLQHNLPTVMIESHSAAFSSVEIDNQAGGRLAAEYLIKRGHRQIAFLGIDAEIAGCTLPTSNMRLQGFQATLAEAGLSLIDIYVRNASNDMEAAYTQAKTLLTLGKRPTAIFVTSDILALGAIKAARELGLKIPTDIAILGFDDLDIADYIGLTTVRQSLDESGRIAVELLLGRLAYPMRPIQHVQLGLTIVERDTA